jgi:CheY-like chemotaxis protein
VNEAGPESEPTQKAGTPDHGNETILLAEDDKGVFTIATTFLEMAGYRIVGAEDGQKAIEQLKKHASEIDLALLDVMMPHKSGKDVYEYIQEHCPEVKVLFASGYSMNAIHTHFVLDDGVNLLPKPYKRSELLQAVRSVLDS